MIRYEYRTQLLNDIPNAQWEEILNNLGQHRWELVQIIPIAIRGVTQHMGIFKRPEIP